jgi:metal-responsive CopG/Arc/MetJ family transcriptional regulator
MSNGVAIQVRIEAQLFHQLENWRRSQAAIPPRSQAIRQLIEEALRRKPRLKAKPEPLDAVGRAKTDHDCPLA